jgi:hydrogenase nickel incorporation protein HypA/HybF
MHEFSLIQGILEIAADSARLHHIEHVKSVEVEVGQASGVVREALEFAWNAAKKDTALSETALVIIPIPVRAVCRSCQAHYEPVEMFDLCPGCGDVNPEIITGKELRVVAIET